MEQYRFFSMRLWVFVLNIKWKFMNHVNDIFFKKLTRKTPLKAWNLVKKYHFHLHRVSLIRTLCFKESLVIWYLIVLKILRSCDMYDNLCFKIAHLLFPTVLIYIIILFSKQGEARKALEVLKKPDVPIDLQV